MILILITATASVAVYLAICLRFIGAIVSDNGLLNHILFIQGWHIIRIILLLFGRRNDAFIYYNLIHTLKIFLVYQHRALCPPT